VQQDIKRSQSVVLDSIYQAEVSEADANGLVRLELFKNRESKLLIDMEASEANEFAIILLQGARGLC